MLESVERSETDGDGDFSALIETLDRLRGGGSYRVADGNAHRQAANDPRYAGGRGNSSARAVIEWADLLGDDAVFAP